MRRSRNCLREFGETILSGIRQSGAFPSQEDLSATLKKFGRKPGLQTLDYFGDEQIQKLLPYYLTCGAVEIVGKGFADFADMEEITDAELKKFFDGTATQGFIRTLKKFSLTAEYLSDKVYGALLNNRAKLKRPLKMRLVINLLSNELSETQLKILADDIVAKKSYKHGLPDYFVEMLKRVDSDKLHREIAFYLGADKFTLNKIYSTAGKFCPTSRFIFRAAEKFFGNTSECSALKITTGVGRKSCACTKNFFPINFAKLTRAAHSQPTRKKLSTNCAACKLK